MTMEQWHQFESALEQVYRGIEVLRLQVGPLLADLPLFEDLPPGKTMSASEVLRAAETIHRLRKRFTVLKNESTIPK